jgi:hypothetical protein
MRQPVTDAAANRGRGRSHPRARPGWASTDVASGFRPHAACEPEHGPAGSHDRLAHPGAGLRRPRARHSQVPGQPRASRRLGSAPAQTRNGARSRLSRPTPYRHGRARRVRLAGNELLEPLSESPAPSTGTAWSGPRFFALQGRGAATKRKRKLAGAAHKRQRSAAAGRHGSQPGTAMNDAPV